jgi:hypothetical protein
MFLRQIAKYNRFGNSPGANASWKRVYQKTAAFSREPERKSEALIRKSWYAELSEKLRTQKRKLDPHAELKGEDILFRGCE